MNKAHVSIWTQDRVVVRTQPPSLCSPVVLPERGAEPRVWEWKPLEEGDQVSRHHVPDSP